jgi:hypothetical protein
MLQLDYNLKPLLAPINNGHNLISIGSCFAENIGQKLQQFQFNIMLNPNGIVFNPSSIFAQLNGYLLNNKLTPNQLVQFDGLWHSMQHHGSFSGSNQQQVLNKINEAISKAHVAILNTDYLFITVGTAWVYKYKPTNEIAANNHKMDGKLFNKILLNVHYLNAEFEDFYTKLKTVNPNIKLLFSISPVRYIRDGLYENNVSKAALHQLVYNITNQHPTDCFYFPAYEIIIDELRDYRFYKSDMVHPNELAIDYVWKKFVSYGLTEPSKQFIADYGKYLLLINHKPLHTDSLSYKKMEEHLHVLYKSLLEKYSFLNFKNNA